MNFLTLGIVLIVCHSAYGMTRAQLKKTLTVMKKQCIPKVGVAEDKVSRIEQGVFPEERNVMCYVACIYKSIQVVKNNKLNKEMVSKQIDIMYPQEMKDAVKKSVAKCVDIQDNYTDECERVFYATKCLYEDDPPNFIFP
ncbi:general odorant-binding protein 72-like [Choristoneura fumiferana]|uniref:general odorant-binding protein 72-like n=1 Tax=Choristoneura fumiferana TaxID=7141 RepID=UPI003D15620E